MDIPNSRPNLILVPREVLFHKDPATTVEMEVSQHHGRMAVTIREYVDFKGNGNPKPTNRVVRFNAEPEHLAVLINRLVHTLHEVEVYEAS